VGKKGVGPFFHSPLSFYSFPLYPLEASNFSLKFAYATLPVILDHLKGQVGKEICERISVRLF
jgi:hypothetical protein